MIKQHFIVDRVFWKVYVYYDVHEEDTEEILNCMEKVNLPNNYLKSAYTILKENKLNSGLTYTNIRNKTSVIVINKTTDAAQFINSFVHEIAHLANHISLAYKIDLSSEELCYISGDIAQEMFSKCHALMCDCCRKV